MLPDVPPSPPPLIQPVSVSALAIESQIRFLPDRPFKKVLFASPHVRLVMFALEPGQTLPSHRVDSEVLLLVHQGTGSFERGETRVSGKAGDLLAIPVGQPHGFTAKDRLVVLAIIAPDPGRSF
jgi:quercetin dioxygenase-like cupin family protein